MPAKHIVESNNTHHHPDADLNISAQDRTILGNRACQVEIVMKDNHTIGNNPNNVIRWCQIAREEVERL